MTEGVQVWDLNKADIEAFKADGEMGYRIKGGPETFLGKGILDRVSVEVTPVTDFDEWQQLYTRGCVGGDPNATYDFSTDMRETMEFNW
jgi:hypothetical protein